MVHSENKAAVDHHAKTVQAPDGFPIIPVQVLELALSFQVRLVCGFKADEQAAEATVNRLLDQSRREDGVHCAGGLPDTTHAFHAVKQRSRESAVAKKMVVQKVEMAARETFDFGQCVVDALSIEAAPALEKCFFVAEIAHVGTTPRNNDGVWHEVEAALDEVAPNRRRLQECERWNRILTRGYACGNPPESEAMCLRPVR